MTLAASLLVLLASGSSANDGRVPPEAARVVLEKSIADDSPKMVLCIQIDGADPTPAFLRALRRPDRTVVPASACHLSDDVDHPTYYSATHAPAVLLSVSETRWTSPTSIEVKARRFYHPMNGTFCTARLSKSNGHWKLVSLNLCEEL
jgi:hypothetical protein